MIKVFYWSPFISKIATSKAVINSAISLSKYSNKKISPFIINLFGEWNVFSNDIQTNELKVINLFKKNKKIKLPDTGFILSRLSFIIIFLFSFFPLLRLLKKIKPEYLIIHLNTSLPLILLLFFNFETKFILRISGKPRLNFFRKLLWKLISKKIYKVTTPTKSIYSELVNKKIFEAEKLDILYDPIIHLKKFKKESNYYYKKYGKYLIAVGRLTKQKNFKFLINCFEKICDNYGEFSLLILGDGEEKQSLIKIVKEKKLEKKVFLLGYKSDVFSYMRNAYCFILTSLWEDPGFALIEASMTNTIVLSSNCETGPKDLLKDKVNSFVYENNNLEGFFQSFSNLTNSNEKQKNEMRLLMKNEIKKFTLFNHYKKLNEIIL